MNKSFKVFLKNNIPVFMYILCAVILELVSICFIGCKPFFTTPVYSFLIFGTIISMLLLFRNKKAKMIVSSILFVAQGVMNVGFIYLYDSNGTFFEWSMVNQRDDAFGTIEDLELRVGAIVLFAVLLAILIAINIVLSKTIYKNQAKTYKTSRFSRLMISLVLAFCSVFTVLVPVVNGVEQTEVNYVDAVLYGSGDNKYQKMGISSNAIYEFFSGTIGNAARDYSLEGVDEFIKEGGSLETSKYHGISKGNNLVYILVESFEWYAFLDLLTTEQSLELYPNLNKFMNQSIIADNYYSREKTDTSEMLSILGSNPSNKYVNYDFPTNTYPQSLPNLFKNSVQENGNTVVQVKSFHQNDGDFYNRNEMHKSMGFDDLVDVKDMKAYGVENTWDEGNWSIGERTLDSVTIDKMQDQMFPVTKENEQYMTFWLTFSMHGYYVHRQTFEEAGYYDRLDQVGVYPKGKGTKADYLRTYAAAVMDFDKSVGIMMDKLEENGQLENTTVVMFADHNTYYNNLSYYAKNIEEKFNSELYRVPFMIYDQELKQAYQADNGTSVISKFTSGNDILPTVLDLFGIEGYKNLYFGTSMFVEDVESIIYSRAYGIFVTDKLICYSINELLWTCEGFSEKDKQDFIERATIHLTKLEYLDKIFYNNYFKTHKYKPL